MRLEWWERREVGKVGRVRKERGYCGWEGGKGMSFLVLFKGGGCKVRLRFHFFLFSMLIKGKKRQDGIAIGITCTFLR